MSSRLARLGAPIRHRRSGAPEQLRQAPPGSDPAGSRRPPLRRPLLVALLLVAVATGTGPLVPDGAPNAPSDADAAVGLLFTRSQIRARAASGTAWSYLKSVAGQSIGRPQLADINDDESIKALAAAIVYARTGNTTYRAKARKAIMASIGTENSSGGSAMLGVARNLGTIVLAADFINLSAYSADNTKFRSWLKAIRTKRIGSHSKWNTLINTHKSSANNWGAFAGASRIAASRYIGDSADVASAARVLRGFLGDRSAYANFRRPDSTTLSWSCSSASTWRPVNDSCSKGGRSLSGAIPEDVSRGGSFSWPPRGSGITYMQESLQGLLMQAELLQRAGYKPYTWSNKALKRIATFVSSYRGWNPSTASYHVPWILNARYGLRLPTKGARYGRMIGFTDWLYRGTGLKVA